MSKKWMTLTEKQQKITYDIIVPLLLLLFPLVKSGIGVDYMDSMYSPGNFVFFPQMEGTWVIATYLANAIGYLLTKLPGAGIYLGLRIYTNLFVSASALISYFWLRKKIPAWIAAVGEVIAIGFCWCPTTILYNYLTYFFMLLALIFLYEGLCKEKKGFLITAGIFLGMNLLVRFPNVIEVGFIVAVWFYGFLKKKKIKEVVGDTLWCMLGYFLSVGILMGLIILIYGADSYVAMIFSLFGMTDSATSYKPIEMVLAIFREFSKGFKWPAGMALYVLVMTGVFAVCRERFLWGKRAVTVLGILVLFRWYYGQGMFNIDYNTYPSMFQWNVCFLIITIVIFVMSIWSKKVETDQKLMYTILLLLIAITPIGSNNNLFPVMNNQFLLTPVSLYAVYLLIKKTKGMQLAFPMQAMFVAVAAALLVQSIGFGVIFSFRGAREGEVRDTKIEKNDILQGMITNKEKAEAIEELTEYWESQKMTEVSQKQELLLFGHIPGVSYFLNTPCAISTSWPDLESYAYTTFLNDMEVLEKEMEDEGIKPTVILSFGADAVITNDAKAMEWYANNMESGEETLDIMLASKKLAYLGEFLQSYGYERTFLNQRFVVYE